VDPCIWKEAVRKDAHQKAIGPHNRDKGGVCTKERKGVPIVEREEGRGAQVHQ